jgi:hypothetical protein
MSNWNEVPFPTDAGVLNLPHTRLNPGDLLRKMLKLRSVKESADPLEIAFLVLSRAFGPTQWDDSLRIG